MQPNVEETKTCVGQRGREFRAESKASIRTATLCFLVTAVLLLPMVAAADPPGIPQYGRDIHEGVSSCDGSTCLQNCPEQEFASHLEKSRMKEEAASRRPLPGPPRRQSPGRQSTQREQRVSNRRRRGLRGVSWWRREIPPAAQPLRKDLRTLHQTTSEGRGDAKQTANAIRANLSRLLPRLEAWTVDGAVLRELATRILKEAVSGEYTVYAGSEQAARVLQTIVYNPCSRASSTIRPMIRSKGGSSRTCSPRSRIRTPSTRIGPSRASNGCRPGSLGNSRIGLLCSGSLQPGRGREPVVSRTTCRLRRRTGFSNRRRYADQRSQR